MDKSRTGTTLNVGRTDSTRDEGIVCTLLGTT